MHKSSVLKYCSQYDCEIGFAHVRSIAGFSEKLKISCFPSFRNESGRFGALKSDSTHHFFRNACTKSGSLRFSQFSGCWLILSVYILMSFDFPFVTFLLTPYLYTFSLYENPSFIIFSAETEYISTRSWYRNINFLYRIQYKNKVEHPKALAWLATRYASI
jgi:hypothetical protein